MCWERLLNLAEWTARHTGIRDALSPLYPLGQPAWTGGRINV